MNNKMTYNLLLLLLLSVTLGTAINRSPFSKGEPMRLVLSKSNIFLFNKKKNA